MQISKGQLFNMTYKNTALAAVFLRQKTKHIERIKNIIKKGVKNKSTTNNFYLSISYIQYCTIKLPALKNDWTIEIMNLV